MINLGKWPVVFVKRRLIIRSVYFGEELLFLFPKNLWLKCVELIVSSVRQWDERPSERSRRER